MNVLMSLLKELKDVARQGPLSGGIQELGSQDGEGLTRPHQPSFGKSKGLEKTLPILSERPCRNMKGEIVR